MKVVNALLARKEIQINQAANNGVTPLFMACTQNYLNIVKLLKNKNDTMNCSTAEQMNHICFHGYSAIQAACDGNHMDIVLFSIYQGLPDPGTSNAPNSMQLPWFEMLNNANQHKLLALAEQNRDEHYTSYSTFLFVIQKTVQLNLLHEQTNNATAIFATPNVPIAHFCLSRPQQPLRLIADYLCGPKEARLLWCHIILHCISEDFSFFNF